MLNFATAGHHPAYLLAAGTTQPIPLGTRNPSIGIGADRDVATARAPVPAGSTLALFSDGVFEITDHDGRDWDLSQVLEIDDVNAVAFAEECIPSSWGSSDASGDRSELRLPEALSL